MLLPGLPVCTCVVCVRVSLLTTGEHSSKSMTSPAGGITVQLSEWGAGVQMTRENERPPVCTSSADWTDPYARFRPACGIRQQRQEKGRQDRARLARLFPSRKRERAALHRHRGSRVSMGYSKYAVEINGLPVCIRTNSPSMAMMECSEYNTMFRIQVKFEV